MTGVSLGRSPPGSSAVAQRGHQIASQHGDADHHDQGPDQSGAAADHGVSAEARAEQLAGHHHRAGGPEHLAAGDEQGERWR